MARKEDDGISRELLDELIAKRGVSGAADFESLATAIGCELTLGCVQPRGALLTCPCPYHNDLLTGGKSVRS